LLYFYDTFTHSCLRPNTGSAINFTLIKRSILPYFLVRNSSDVRIHSCFQGYQRMNLLERHPFPYPHLKSFQSLLLIPSLQVIFCTIIIVT
ncbi:hypothetical protein L9F63_016004, partial [Diploptera punctata]